MPEISYELLDLIIDKLNEMRDECPVFGGADYTYDECWASEELCKLRSTLERIRDSK